MLFIHIELASLTQTLLLNVTWGVEDGHFQNFFFQRWWRLMFFIYQQYLSTCKITNCKKLAELKGNRQMLFEWSYVTLIIIWGYWKHLLYRKCDICDFENRFLHFCYTDKNYRIFWRNPTNTLLRLSSVEWREMIGCCQKLPFYMEK